MNKRHRIRRGTVMMVLGTVMILMALSLLLYNCHKETVVGEKSQEVLDEFTALIQNNKTEEQETDVGSSGDDISEIESAYQGDEYPTTQDMLNVKDEGEKRSAEETLPDGVIDGDMYSMLIDGYYYIGILSIPVLDLTLPVQWGWSDELMDISPCRYNGTLEEGDLIIMAHNYSTHFGRIFDMVVGDSVSFTDVLGVTTNFEVCQIDVFGRSQIEKMYEGDWDLTLFTCVPNTYNRIAVRCRIVTE